MFTNDIETPKNYKNLEKKKYFLRSSKFPSDKTCTIEIFSFKPEYSGKIFIFENVSENIIKEYY
jgi:hypothetical protein